MIPNKSEAFRYIPSTVNPRVRYDKGSWYVDVYFEGIWTARVKLNNLSFFTVIKHLDKFTRGFQLKNKAQYESWVEGLRRL